MKTKPIVEGNDILHLIPQRPPIVMVDKFFGVEGDCSYTGLTISEENIFFDKNHLSESGIIEHIAQSAAARIGYIFTQENKAVPLGFIGSVDKMKIYSLPALQDELYTEMKVIQEVHDITLIGAIVKVNETIVAECRMKIVLRNE